MKAQALVKYEVYTLAATAAASSSHLMPHLATTNTATEIDNLMQDVVRLAVENSS